MITVIIPLFNKVESIKNTVNAVLEQSFTNFELLVIDDGSTDDSLSVVKEIDDKRLKIIQKENGGVSSARNLGIAEARFDWVTFLDADDIWHQDFLKNVCDVIYSNNQVKVIGTGYAEVKKDMTILKKQLPENKGFISNYYVVANAKKDCVVISSAVCVHKTAFLEVGVFNESLVIGEDLDMWERLARNNNFWLVDKVLSYYIQDSENRAMQQTRDVRKIWLYYWDTSMAKTEDEKEYYKVRILNYIYDFIVKSDFNNAKLLLNRHYGFVGAGDIAVHFSKNFIKKISNLIKVNPFFIFRCY